MNRLIEFADYLRDNELQHTKLSYAKQICIVVYDEAVKEAWILGELPFAFFGDWCYWNGFFGYGIYPMPKDYDGMAPTPHGCYKEVMKFFDINEQDFNYIFLESQTKEEVINKIYDRTRKT